MDVEHLQPNAITQTEADTVAESHDKHDSQSLCEEKSVTGDMGETTRAVEHANGPAVTEISPLTISPSPDSPVAESAASTSDENVAVQRPAPLDLTKKNFPRRNRYGHRAAQTALNRTRGSGTNPTKALELLRKVLHPSFEREVLPVCRKFMEMLKMGAQNLQENTGEPVASVHIVNALRRSLEEVGMALDLKKTTELPLDFRSAPRTTIATNGQPPRRKRKEPKESIVAKTAPPPKAPKVLQNAEVSGMTWNPDKLDPETRFVMGVKANKAIGFAATRGRIYYRHPEIYKYSGDQDDKVWLYDNGHMPVTGGKAYLMLEEDLVRLCESEEYANNPMVNREELIGFEVPSFMLEKIKADMRQQKQTLQL